MKVKELIEKLKEFDQENEILFTDTYGDHNKVEKIWIDPVYKYSDKDVVEIILEYLEDDDQKNIKNIFCD